MQHFWHKILLVICVSTSFGTPPICVSLVPITLRVLYQYLIQNMRTRLASVWFYMGLVLLNVYFYMIVCSSYIALYPRTRSKSLYIHVVRTTYSIQFILYSTPSTPQYRGCNYNAMGKNYTTDVCSACYSITAEWTSGHLFRYHHPRELYWPKIKHMAGN